MQVKLRLRPRRPTASSSDAFAFRGSGDLGSSFASGASWTTPYVGDGPTLPQSFAYRESHEVVFVARRAPVVVVNESSEALMLGAEFTGGLEEDDMARAIRASLEDSGGIEVNARDPSARGDPAAGGRGDEVHEAGDEVPEWEEVYAHRLLVGMQSDELRGVVKDATCARPVRVELRRDDDPHVGVVRAMVELMYTKDIMAVVQVDALKHAQGVITAGNVQALGELALRWKVDRVRSALVHMASQRDLPLPFLKGLIACRGLLDVPAVVDLAVNLSKASGHRHNSAVSREVLLLIQSLPREVLVQYLSLDSLELPEKFLFDALVEWARARRDEHEAAHAAEAAAQAAKDALLVEEEEDDEEKQAESDDDKAAPSSASSSPLQPYLEGLLDLIRFPLMKSEQLVQVAASNLLPQEHAILLMAYNATRTRKAAVQQRVQELQQPPTAEPASTAASAPSHPKYRAKQSAPRFHKARAQKSRSRSKHKKHQDAFDDTFSTSSPPDVASTSTIKLGVLQEALVACLEIESQVEALFNTQPRATTNQRYVGVNVIQQQRTSSSLAKMPMYTHSTDDRDRDMNPGEAKRKRHR